MLIPLNFIRMLILGIFIIYSCKTFSLEVNGMAVHEELGNEQFIAALHLTHLTKTAKSVIFEQKKQQLDLKILAKKISPRHFRRIWVEGIAVNLKEKNLARHAVSLEEFSKIIKVNLVENDIVTFRRSQDGIIITLNSVKIGSISDDNFYNILIQTFVGQIPLSSQLKNHLLAAGNIKSSLIHRFNQISPTLNRIEQVKSIFSTRKKIKQKINTQQNNTKSNTATDSSMTTISKQATAQAETPTLNKNVVIANFQSNPEIGYIPNRGSNLQLLSSKNLTAGETPTRSTDDDEVSAKSILSSQLHLIKVRRLTKRNIIYPEKASRKGQEGQVTIAVTLDKLGEIISAEYIERSNYKALDKAAMRAVKKSAPYPPMPADIKDTEFNFTAPFAFKINN